MAKVTVVMTGDKDINRKLKRLTGPQQKKAVRKAIRPALKPVMQQTRSNLAPFKQTGKLQKSVKVRSLKRSRGGFGARVTTGTDGSDFQGDTFYGAFLEYGFKHRGGAVVYGEQYMKNAARTKKQVALKIYRESIRANIMALAKA